MEYGQLSENSLSLPRTANHHVDCPASSFSRMSCFPITGDYTYAFIKTVTMNHAVDFMVHSIYRFCCMQVSLAAIRIHSLKYFDSELQLINTGHIQSPVLFSGRDEELLERNKCSGHNLRQYSSFYQEPLLQLMINNIVQCIVFRVYMVNYRTY